MLNFFIGFAFFEFGALCGFFVAALMQEAEGVTEALKAVDQLEWVRRMNSIRNRAEEIIKTELIFV